MSVAAGDYRHLVTIQEPTDTLDGPDRGDTIIDYRDVSDEFCSIQPLLGREFVFAKQVRGDLTHKVEMRFRPDISHRTRLKWLDDGGKIRYYNAGPIINHDMRNVVVWFYATEIL